VSDPIDDLASLWRWFSTTQFRGYSPIYERLAECVAEDRELLHLLRQAPPAAHLPLAPLGAVRYLLLDGLEHPLGDVYAGRSGADPGSLFLDLCRANADSVLDLLEFRRVQTNDCGRSAIVGPALTWAVGQDAGPWSFVDVGASAGLNLRCDRYRIDYGDHGASGPADSPVQIECEVIGGAPPIAPRLPDFARRVGIDLSPIDVTDERDARWLLACVWPDTGRADRVAASIELARSDPPVVLTGAANDVLPDVLTDLPAGEPVVVMTTWAFGYFSLDDRDAFVDLLRTASTRRRVVWISAEHAGTVALDDTSEATVSDGSVLAATVFDTGSSATHLLARVHDHGNWIDWRA
jgi:hypothetical protein